VASTNFGGSFVHYEIAGSGFPLVLLHGIGSNARSWHRQTAAFATRYCVIAWDAPGFGKSAELPEQEPSIRAFAASLRELLDSLDVKSAVLLGHSLGGIIAQQFYADYPERVGALVLADTTQGGSANLSERLRMIRTMTPGALAEQRAPKLLSPHAPPELLRETIEIMSQVRQPGYEFAAIAVANSDLRGVLDHINVPLLMIWGAEDTITPRWERWPQQARVEIIPGAGHLCYAEQPELFNLGVLRFLQGVPGGNL
jgi:pimeloyl-ACP methyl ester carboxylesterase